MSFIISHLETCELSPWVNRVASLETWSVVKHVAPWYKASSSLTGEFFLNPDRRRRDSSPKALSGPYDRFSSVVGNIPRKLSVALGVTQQAKAVSLLCLSSYFVLCFPLSGGRCRAGPQRQFNRNRKSHYYRLPKTSRPSLGPYDTRFSCQKGCRNVSMERWLNRRGANRKTHTGLRRRNRWSSLETIHRLRCERYSLKRSLGKGSE